MPLDVVQAVRDVRSGSGELSLEQRLYRLLCLVTGLLMLGVVIPINAFEHVSWILNVTVGLFGVLALVLYALAPRGVMFVKSYLLFIVIVLNVSWFTDAGANGSIGYFFFAAVVYTGIFFRGRLRTTLLVLFTLNGLALIVADYLYPKFSIPFENDFARMLDLTTGFVVSTIGLSLMIWVLRAGFDGERRRQVELNRQLAEALEVNRRRTEELEATLAEVKTLRGLLPICSNCKSVRDDAGLWTQIERYVSSHTDASFTHSLCPGCMRHLFPEDAEAVLAKMNHPTAS